MQQKIFSPGIWKCRMSDVDINTRKVCMRSLWRRFRVSKLYSENVSCHRIQYICNSMHTHSFSRRKRTHCVKYIFMLLNLAYLYIFHFRLPKSVCQNHYSTFRLELRQRATAFPHQLPPHNVTWKVQNRFCQCKAHNLFDIRRIDWRAYTILVSLNYDPWRHDGNSSGNETNR